MRKEARAPRGEATRLRQPFEHHRMSSSLPKCLCNLPRAVNYTSTSGDLMTFGGVQRVVVTALLLLVALALLFASPRMLAQTASGTGTLRGQVTDPSGSSIANATVIVTTPTGNAITATTNREGIYEIKNLAPGEYGVKVMSQGFAPFDTPNVEVLAGQIQKLDVPLTIEVREEKVT